MITLTGNGRLTREPQLRTTHSGKTVATISVASDRRDRTAGAIYIDLVVWEAQATAAAEHLVKGQAVSFAGRLRAARVRHPRRRSARRARAARRRPRVRRQAPRHTSTEPAERPSRPQRGHDGEDIPF